MGSGIRVLLWLVVTVAVLVGAFFGLTRRFTVGLDTMAPTMKNGDHVAVFRFSDTVTNPTRKDVVVIYGIPSGCDAGAASYVVERIIGLPGETVTERKGEFSVEGKPLKETYVGRARRDHRSGSWHVPHDAYLVAGDNRRSPCATPALVMKKHVVGFVIFTYWPADRISIGS
jgi:signal peptidase I